MSVENGWCPDQETCVQNNMDLVRAVMHAKIGRTNFAAWARQQDVPQEDLESAGAIALFKAWRGFDPDERFRFSTYAVPAIERELRDCILREGRDGQGLTDTQRKERAAVLAALTKLRDESGREPSDEEIAFATGVLLDEVREHRKALPTVVSGDEPLGREPEEGEPRIELTPDPKDPPTEILDREENEEFLASFKSRLRAAGLTMEEVSVLTLRWGLDQPHLEPRPRAKVAQLLTEEHGYDGFVVTGKQRAKSATPPKYLTDQVRRIELRATRKVAEHFADLRRPTVSAGTMGVPSLP